MSAANPPPDPDARAHTDGPFARAEVALANRNSGLPLEALRHDVTPAGMHYLLTHFDVPFVRDAAEWRLSVEGWSQIRSHCRWPISSACPCVPSG